MNGRNMLPDCDDDSAVSGPTRGTSAEEQRIIPSRLLDRFEQSRHLLDPGSSSRRVMLRIDRKELPEYRYDQSAEIRDSFNCAAVGLESAGLVRIEWARPNLMQCIILTVTKVDSAYLACGRVHPKVRASRFIDLVESHLCTVTCDWIRQWKHDVCQRAEQTYKLPAFCKESFDLLVLLLTALQVYDARRGEPISMRAFSIACYHDSKRFERDCRDEFLRVATRYCPDLQNDVSGQELNPREKLAILGIEVRPELLELCGNCTRITKNGCISLSAAGNCGLALPSTLVSSISSWDMSRIDVVTFIENKTNYDEYLLSEKADHELVIYHGGFLSPQNKRFLQGLSLSLAPRICVRFWADIDLGGFRMFSGLQTFFPGLQPYRMGADEIRRFAGQGLSRTEDYLRDCQEHLDRNDFPLFSECLAEILRLGVTVEQEVFLG